ELVMAGAIGDVVFRAHAHAEQRGDIDMAIGGTDDADAGAQFGADIGFDLFEHGGINKVGLVDDDHVGGGELIFKQFAERGLVIEHFVLTALGIDGGFVGGKTAFGKGGRVGDGDDAINGDLGLDFGPVEGADQRLRQGETGGFNDDVIELFLAGEQRLHGGDELVGHGAADAAIGELDHILFAAGLVAAAGENVLVDAQIAKLIDDQRDALALGAWAS